MTSAALRWTRRRAFLVFVVALAIWALVDVRTRGRVDPANLGLHKTDFTVYTEAGAAFFDGRDPYQVSNPRGWGYLYPPLFAILVAPLHAIAPENQVMVWFAISALAVWGCYLESVRIARVVLPGRPDRGPFGPIAPWIGWAALITATLPALNCLQRGQVGTVKMLLLLVGFRLLIESRSIGRSFVAGAVLALPIAIKVSPLVIVGSVLFEQLVAAWRSRPCDRALPRVGACAGGTLAGLAVCLLIVPSMLVGWQANMHHLDTWWTKLITGAEHSTGDVLAGDSYSIRNQSLANAVRRMGNWVDYRFAGGPHDEGLPPDAHGQRGLIMDRPIVARLLFVVRGLEGCLLLATALLIGRRNQPLGHAALFGLACASTLVISPIARGHYYVQMLPAVMFVGAWLAAAGRARWAAAAVGVPLALTVAHYVLMDFTGRIGLLGIGTAAWFTACCLLSMHTAATLGSNDKSADMPGPWLASHLRSDRQRDGELASA